MPKANLLDPKFECVVTQELSSFRCEHLSCTTFEAEHPWHFHPAFELTWIIRSRGMRYVGSSAEPYEPGDLALVGPNLPHCWRNDSMGQDFGTPQWIVAQFDPACFGTDLLALPEAIAVRSLLEEARFGVVFGPDAAAKIGDQFNELVHRSGMARLVGLIDILDRLSSYPRKVLADIGYHKSNDVDLVMLDRLNRVQQFIDDNLAEEISQSVIADQLGLSASAFSKFFRAATGRTFMGMVKLLRINAACQMLAHGDDRITDVALSTGYQHTSHFAQHFRELKGMSPSEYRRRTQTL